MAKKLAPLDIMNVMGKAAHNRAQAKPADDDEAAMPPGNPKQKAAIAASQQAKGTKFPPKKK